MPKGLQVQTTGSGIAGGGQVHKFLDDGSVVLGSGSLAAGVDNKSVTFFDSANSGGQVNIHGHLTASVAVSASFFEGDGSRLTNISATSIKADDIAQGDAAVTLSTSAGAINITPAAGSAIVLDGTISVDAGVVTGATSVTSTAFVGDLTGDVTGNADTATVATTVTISDNENTNEDNAIVFTSGGDVDGGNIGLESDGDLTYNPSTGRLNATQLGGTLQTAAQTNVTSLGTLSALNVDDVNIDGKVMTMTGATGDTAVFTVGTNGDLSIVTTDTAAAAANIQITADGTVDIDSAGVLTLDSGAGINLEPAAGSAILLDGTISIDAGVVTGATSITSTAFVGDLTGDVTGTADTATVATTVTISDNESTNEDNKIIFGAGAAGSGNLGLEADGDLTYNPSTGRLNATQLGGTLQTAAQTNVTSLGTLSALTVDNVVLDGATIGHTADTDLMTLANGILTVAGEVSMTTLDLGGTNVTADANEINVLDGATSANNTASKAVLMDGSGNVTLAGDLTVTGNTITNQVEVVSTSTGVLFEGGVDDGHEATLISSVASSDKTYTLPNLTGHIPLLAGAATAADVTYAEFALLDGGSSIGTTAVSDGHGIVMNHGGTMAHTTVETLAAYLDDEITAMPNLVTTAATTVGTLDSGAISSGFGNIDNGSSTLNTGAATVDSLSVSNGGITNAGSIAGATSIDGSGDLTMGTITMTGFTVDADGDTALKSLLVDDNSTIGLDSDTDLLTLKSNLLEVAGNLSASINVSASGFYGDGSNLTGVGGAVAAVSNTADYHFAILDSNSAQSAASFFVENANVLKYNPNNDELMLSGTITAHTGAYDTLSFDYLSGAAGKNIEISSEQDVVFVIDANGGGTQNYSFKTGTSSVAELDEDGNFQMSGALSASIGVSSSGHLIVDGTSQFNSAIDVKGTITGDTSLTLDSTTITTAEIGVLDGVTAGTGAASKAVTLDASSDFSGARNVTITGELDAASLDISGNADIDGTLEADAITVNGATLQVVVEDHVGAMLDGTETGIAVSYDSTDNNLDFVIDAAQTTITSILATDLKIGEDDQTKIDFETADTINFYAGNEKQLILTDGALTPGANNIVDLGTDALEFKDAYFDGTVEADAYTVAGTALSTYIQGITVDNATTAAVATTVTISDNESTNEDNAIVFTSGGDVDGGNIGLESDGDLTYNPSTGRLNATQLGGTLQTAAQGNVTSLGTLTGLTVNGDATLTGDSANAVWDKSANALEFADNAKVTFGTGDDASIYWDGSALKVGTESTATPINIGHSTSLVTIGDDLTVTGDLIVQGDTVTMNVATMSVEDKNIHLGVGAANATAIRGAGLDFEMASDVDAGFIRVGASDASIFELKAPNAAGVLTLDLNASKTMTVAGDLNIEADSAINQDLSTDSTTAQLATLTIATSLVPDASAGADLGSTSAEWNDLYLADDSVIKFGNAQDAQLAHDNSNQLLAFSSTNSDYGLKMPTVSGNSNDGTDFLQKIVTGTSEAAIGTAASAYNGVMFYLSAVHSGSASVGTAGYSAQQTFRQAGKFYFIENGVVYPSPFISE